MTAGRTRSRRLVEGVLTALIGRGSAAAASFLLVGVTLGYLGPLTFGLWMTVAAMTSMALWADLGLGNTLMTRLTPAVARQDWATARRLVASTYGLLSVVAAVLLAVLWLGSTVVPWRVVFATTDPAVAALGERVALLCFTAFAVNMPVSLVQRVQYASGQISASNLWQLAGNVTAVLAAWAAVQLRLAPLVVVACAVSAPLLGNLANSAWFFRGAGAALRPRFAGVSRSVMTQVLQIGPLFLLISVASSVSVNLDNLVVTHVLGLTAVTSLAVPVKLFTFLGLVVSVVNLPLWPLNAEAFAQGDHRWVRRITRRMTLLSTAGVVVPGVVLVLVGRPVLLLLTGLDLGADRWLLTGLVVWWAVVGATSPRFMVQNAAGVLGPQLVGWLAFLLLSLPVKVWALTTFGLPVLPFAAAGLYAVTVLPAAHLGYRRALRGASASVALPSG